ncbi:hypothetical protein L7F22_012502 [Adiantum nelumboides]|nr:hypothetical protein [Adiantum nelumboides]
MFPSFVCQPHAFSFCRASVIQTAACKWRGAAARLLFPEKNCIPDSYFGTRRCANVRAQKSEEENALSAAGFADTGAPTIFDKIIKKEIPSTVVYEDDKVLAFRDINPQAPIHIILIPKVPDGLTQLSKADERHKDILGHLMYTTGVIAKQEGIAEGYRVVINNGPTACMDSLALSFLWFAACVQNVSNCSMKKRRGIVFCDWRYFVGAQ